MFFPPSALFSEGGRSNEAASQLLVGTPGPGSHFQTSSTWKGRQYPAGDWPGGNTPSLNFPAAHKPSASLTKL